MMVSYRGRSIPFSPVKTILTLLFIVGGMGVLGAAFTSDKGAADFFDVGGYFAEDAEPVYLADKDGDKKSKESDEDKAKRLKGQAKDWLKYRGEDRYEGWVRTKADKKKLEKIDKDIDKHIDKKSLTGEKAANYRDQTRKDELTKLENSKVSISWYAWLVIFFALAAAGFALFTAKKFFAEVKAKEPGNKEMVEIADAVTDGAMAYLNRQKKIVSPTLLAVAVTISLIVGLLGADAWWLSIFVFFGIMSGGALSFLAGWIGMKTATMASSRTAWACKEDGLDGGLQVAFKAGAVMGLLVVGLGLAFVSTWALVMFGIVDLASDITMKEAANAMITFGLGASLVALFARVGGGIFTKAADVGADLVGKVEAGIPEDDPRNPATIADNVGDNVGDVAGMGADLYESYVGSILASIALSWSAATALGRDPWAFMAAPLLIAAGGILLSIYSTRLVKAKEGANLKELLHSLHKGVNFASIGSAGVALVVCLVLFGWAGLGFFGAAVVGLVSGLIIGKGSELYTAYDYAPTQGIAKASATGPATVIISGLAVGMKSTWIPMITVAVATLLAFGLGGGFAVPAAGLYAIALAAVGMLSTLGITLATDAYGPIADNAGGNAEMAKLPAEVRERTDALDSLGNTTAAIGKGFAIGSAALTALALIASFHDAIGSFLSAKYNALMMAGETEAASELSALFEHGMNISLTNPAVIAGLFIGAMLVFIFGALTMQAVGDAAKEMVEEVRRQFREEPGIMLGTVKPDYARCVDISTTSALRLMMFPSILAVAGPIVTGILFGAPAVFGLLAGALAAGFAFAVMMSNSGGAWDNAKKWVEKGGLAEAMIESGEYDPAKEDAALQPVTADQGGPDGKKGKGKKKGAGKSGKNKKTGTSSKQKKVDADKKDEEKSESKAESKEDSSDDSKAEEKPEAKEDKPKAEVKKDEPKAEDKSEDSDKPKYLRYVKGTEEHKATVVGDTVGDPFKDTSGPSLNILIKLMSMVSVATVALIMAVNNGQGIFSWVFDAIFKY